MLMRGIVKRLFDTEDNPRRFEDVTRELVADAEGIVLVPTSPTWDLARDARDITPGPRGPNVVLLATLSTQLDDKIDADITRLTQTTAATRLYYCSSKPLSEHGCDELAGEIKRRHPSAQAVSVLGQHQLAGLVDNEPRELIIRRYYAAEIKNIEDALLHEPTPDADPRHLGLRLALISQTGEDARALRAQLARRLVLETLLVSGAPQSSGDLAQSISKQLHLPRSISADYIAAISTDLKDEKLIVEDPSRHFVLTESGRAEASTVPNLEEASGRLLEGREAVREALERLSGHRLLDEEYGVLWTTFQDELSRLFYSQGTSIIRMIDSLLTGQTTDYSPDLMLSDLANRIGAQFHDTLRDDITTAVVDMFSEKESVAFRWLTEVSSTYVMMCTLGLENLSAQEVESLIKDLNLVADSDLILSLLCQREDNHEEVRRVFAVWRALGGRLSVATPVLEEVAYHAWIANFTYAELEDHLGSITEPEASTRIDNAFVRSFRLLSPQHLGRRAWGSYIAQYRGERSYDYGNILEILVDEFNFAVLPSPTQEHTEFATEVFRFLRELAAQEFHCESDELDRKVNDKCRRDAQLLAAVLSSRQAARAAGLRSTTIVVSSARRMKDADLAFRQVLGQPESVLSTAAVACLLMLTPGVRMNLSTIRQLLFDVSLARRLTPLQHFALRVISRSSQFDLPLSRRVSLQRELRERVLSDARRRGEPVRNVTRRLVTVQNPEYSASVVADALDALAIRSSGTQAMREEIRQLTKDLQAERTKSKINAAPKRTTSTADKAAALKALRDRTGQSKARKKDD